MQWLWKLTKIHLIVYFVTKATDTEWQHRALHGILFLFLHQDRLKDETDLSSLHIRDVK